VNRAERLKAEGEGRRGAIVGFALTTLQRRLADANVDCIEQLAKDELSEYLGALSPGSMCGVNQVLAIAVALV